MKFAVFKRNGPPSVVADLAAVGAVHPAIDSSSYPMENAAEPQS
jgi:hypothetical protein